LYEYLKNPFFIEYQKEYNNDCEYIDLSKSFNLPGVNFFFFLTLEKNKIENKLNYYGKSIRIEEFVLNNSLLKKTVFKYLNDLILKYNIKTCDVRINIFNDNFINNNSDFDVINELYVDLSFPEITIRKNFKQSHRTILNKIYEDLNYEIIDYKNYNGEILEMEKMHIEVSGKKTRSRSSWLINEKMLINNYGFITKVSNKEKFLSYYFFFFDKVTTVYFSSVTYREYFKIYKNLGHASIWSAIKYSKNVSKFLYLGDENSSSSLTNKEKNIETFKKGFNNFKKKIITINGCNNLLNYFEKTS